MRNKLPCTNKLQRDLKKTTKNRPNKQPTFTEGIARKQEINHKK